MKQILCIFSCLLMSLYGYAFISSNSNYRDVYIKQCEAGNAKACYQAGQVYSTSFDIPHSSKLALEYYEKSCKGGIEEGCADAGFKKKDKEKLFKFYEEEKNKCDNGEWHGCRNLGSILNSKSGWGIELYNPEKSQKAYDRMLEILKNNCNKDDFESCRWIAEFYSDGTDGVSKNISMTIKYFTLACNGGIQYACSRFGQFYMTKVSPPEPAKALVQYQKACDMKMQPSYELSCSKVAMLYSEKTYGLYNEKKAIDMYLNLCPKRPSVNLIPCYKLYLYYKEKGDTKLADEYHKVACLFFRDKCEEQYKIQMDRFRF